MLAWNELHAGSIDNSACEPCSQWVCKGRRWCVSSTTGPAACLLVATATKLGYFQLDRHGQTLGASIQETHGWRSQGFWRAEVGIHVPSMSSVVSLGCNCSFILYSFSLFFHPVEPLIISQESADS